MSDGDAHIRIHKWDELQHYKDRDPPWIKLYNRLLDHYEYSRLPDAIKGQYTGLILLASRRDNEIPLDVDWIANQINATAPVDLRPLVNAGLIEVYHHDSEPLSQGDSNPQAFARSREERREEGEESQSHDDTAPAREEPDVRGFDRLTDLLGEHEDAAYDFAEDVSARGAWANSIVGQFHPNEGTFGHLLKQLDEDRRGAILAATLLRYAGEETEYDNRLFRGYLDRVISEESKNGDRHEGPGEGREQAGQDRKHREFAI